MENQILIENKMTNEMGTVIIMGYIRAILG